MTGGGVRGGWGIGRTSGGRPAARTTIPPARWRQDSPAGRHQRRDVGDGVVHAVARALPADGDGLVEVLLHAAPGVDERGPVGALYRDAAVRNEVVEDLLHRGEVDGLDATICVNEELSNDVK